MSAANTKSNRNNQLTAIFFGICSFILCLLLNIRLLARALCAHVIFMLKNTQTSPHDIESAQ